MLLGKYKLDVDSLRELSVEEASECSLLFLYTRPVGAERSPQNFPSRTVMR